MWYLLWFAFCKGGGGGNHGSFCTLSRGVWYKSPTVKKNHSETHLWVHDSPTKRKTWFVDCWELDLFILWWARHCESFWSYWRRENQLWKKTHQFREKNSTKKPDIIYVINIDQNQWILTRLLGRPQPQIYPPVALNQYTWVNRTHRHF